MASPIHSSTMHDLEQGFSLAELVVVLAIIGVLAGAAMPSLMGHWHTASLNAGARELASAMNLGRQLAISRKTFMCVDLSGTSVRLRVGGCTGAQWTGPVTDVSGAIRIGDAATLEISSNGRAVFNALGAATPGATYTVTHARTHASRAVVVAASGRISVQ